METHLISIIIVNWNGLTYMKECFASLSELKTRHKLEIIVVDNASTDTSVEWLKENKFKWPIQVVENKKNLGFAEGNNKGIEWAKGKYILFLNNDTVVQKNFLDILIHSLELDAKRAAIQPKILQLADGTSSSSKKLIDSIGSYFINSGFLYHVGHNKLDSENYSKPNPVFSMKGACMLFRSSVLKSIGGFDKKFFAYFEETDLCIRTLLAGYEIWYEPKAVIYHKGGGTSQNIQPSFILMHAYKNRLYAYLKNFELSTLFRILPIHISFMFIVSLAYFAQLKFGQSFAVVRALWWNIRHVRSIVGERQKIKLLRKVADSAYLSQVTKSVRLSYYYHLMTTSLTGYIDD